MLQSVVDYCVEGLMKMMFSVRYRVLYRRLERVLLRLTETVLYRFNVEV